MDRRAMPGPIPRSALPGVAGARLWRVALIALPAMLMLLAMLVLRPALAVAHAQLVAVDPPDGAILGSPPVAVTVTFDEPVGLAAGGLRVVDATGRTVDQGDDRVDGPLVTQALAPLDDGWYVVTWGVVSEDGHIVRASSAFGVGDADVAVRPGGGASGGSAATAVTRFAGDLGLLIAAGAWVAWWFLRARTSSARRLALAATVLAFAGTAAWAVLEVVDGGAGWVASTAAPLTAGRLVLLSVALVAGVLSAGAHVAGAHVAARPGRWAMGAAIAVWLALPTLGGGGHSAGDPVAMLLLSAHLVAAVAWLGAAPAVLLVLREPEVPDSQATDVVRRFSRLAGAALVGVAAAGAALAWNLSDGLAGGIGSPWAATMVVKVALVGAAALLGLAGRRHLSGAIDRRRLRRLFAVDAGLLVCVALASSLLTLNGPHTGHAGHLATGDARCAMVVGERSVSVIATPGRTGTNSVLVGGVPPDVRSVVLSWAHDLTQGGSLTMEASPSTDGWRASGPLPAPGLWVVTVAVRADTFTQQTGSCSLLVAP